MLSQKIKRFCIVGALIVAIFVYCSSIAFGEEPRELLVGFAAWSQLCPRDVAETVALKKYTEEINAQGKYKLNLIVTDAAGKEKRYDPI